MCGNHVGQLNWLAKVWNLCVFCKVINTQKVGRSMLRLPLLVTVTLFVARMWMSIFITQCIWWYSLSDRQKPISLGGGWCCLVEQTTFSRDDLLTAQDPFSEHYSTLYLYRGLSVAPLTFVLFRRRAIIIDFVNYDTRMPLAHYPLFHLLSLLSS